MRTGSKSCGSEIMKAKNRLRLFYGNPFALISAALLCFILLAIVIIPLVSPYKYNETLKGARNLAPFEYSAEEQADIRAGETVFPHIFGTDELGRDYLVRVAYAAGISIAIGLLSSLAVMMIGVVYGSVAGYFGGHADRIMMSLVDIIFSLPDLLIIIILSLLFSSITRQSRTAVPMGAGMFSILIVFSLVYWVGMARVVRGQVMSVKHREYVQAARAMGASAFYIIRKHIIPNCLGIIIVTTTLEIPLAIFTESFLSFLGLGVQAPMPSLGSLTYAARGSLQSFPHKLIFPSIAICLIVLAFNLLGDGLRDALDPRQTERGQSKPAVLPMLKLMRGRRLGG